MALIIPSWILKEINSHGESAYPEEGAGILLGVSSEGEKRVEKLIKFENAREESARHNRYLLTPQDYQRAEQAAERLELDVVGVFHSHPDHLTQPSEFDREWAIPWFSYIITSVRNGRAITSRSWLLSDDRMNFNEEPISVEENKEL